MTEPLHPSAHLFQTALFAQPAQARRRCLALLNDPNCGVQLYLSCSIQLALIEDQLGASGEALQHLVRAERLATEQPDWLGCILEQQGRCHYTCARYSEALACWQRALELRQPAHSVTLALVGVGQILDALSEHALAIALHRRALALAEPLPLPYLHSVCLINLACNLLALDAATEAKPLLEQAQALCRRNGMPHHEAETLWRLAEIALQQSRLDDASELIENALMLLIDTPYHWGETCLLNCLARLHARRGNPQAALQTAQRALNIARSDGLLHQELRLAHDAHSYALACQQPEQAAQWQQRATQLEQQLAGQTDSCSQLEPLRQQACQLADTLLRAPSNPRVSPSSKALADDTGQY